MRKMRKMKEGGAFNILQLHPTAEHIIYTKFPKELLYPSSRLHMHCLTPIPHTHVSELWVRPLKQIGMVTKPHSFRTVMKIGLFL